MATILRLTKTEAEDLADTLEEYLENNSHEHRESWYINLEDILKLLKG